MLATFDRNVEYKSRLDQGEGSDVPYIETVEGVISITVPVVACESTV